jgi:predicted porin
MKKSLLALAVLGAFAGIAQAQTAVQIYGSFDGGVRYVDEAVIAGPTGAPSGRTDSRWTMGSTGTYNSNRIGFKGVEDLGGGLNAHFTLETGFNTGTGGLDNATNRLFNRTAAVGLGGAWGSLDLGRQYTVAFKTIAAYDPFTYKYPGIALAVPATAGVRYDNDVQYTGTFGPITARAEYAFGEQTGSNRALSNRAVGANYNAGPLAIGAAYTQLNGAAPTEFRTKHWTVGGAFKFGPARLAAGYADQKTPVTVTGLETETKWSWVGLNYAVTPAIEITPAFYRQKAEGRTAAGASAEGRHDKLMLSATYAFSKRTNLYALVDQSRYQGAIRTATLGAGSPEDRQLGVAVGVNHLF